MLDSSDEFRASNWNQSRFFEKVQTDCVFHAKRIGKKEPRVRIIGALLIKTIDETSFRDATFERKAEKERQREKRTKSRRGTERWREGGSTTGKDGVKMEGEKYEWDGGHGNSHPLDAPLRMFHWEYSGRFSNFVSPRRVATF